MSYQRFNEAKGPNAYIWSSGEVLHLCAEGISHNGDQYPEGVVEVVFDISDTTTAERLLVALTDHLAKVRAALDQPSRPISEGKENRGGINVNPSDNLSRPAPPQPYNPRPIA
jgi:hypothetical protein